jgi:uroporphyrinogen decarboxylase
MTHKEQLLKAINKIETKRPAVYCSVVPQLAERLSEYFGIPCEQPLDSLLGSRISYRDLMLKLGSDCVCVSYCAPDNAPTRTLENGRIVNEFGMVMERHGLYDEFVEFPLSHAETVEDIENYPFPDANDPGRFRYAEETVKKFGKDYGIIGDLECCIYETSWYLVGLEKLLMDMAMEKPYVDALFDKVAHFSTECGKKMVEMGVDVIWCGDDFGTQNGPVMSVKMFDRYFAPRIEKMFKAFKEINPNVKIAWHSCGSILPLIPRFIDVGLDILNPIQPLARGMEPQYLKDTYGDRLCFFGGICVQELLPHGTPQQIKAEVKRRARILGKGGGYILAPAHNIQADTPVENVLAMFEAVKEMEEE